MTKVKDSMIKGFRVRIVLSLCLILSIFLQGTSLAAPKKPSVIRDTEIENILHEWAQPIFKAANIAPENVNLILLQSNGLNAFVAGGANIFFYTGLLVKTTGPDEVIGVLAHELGHISGGHLIAGRESLRHASYESIIGTIIGIGAAVLSGSGDAALAVSSGVSNYAARKYLARSRVNEASADQAAMSYFEKAKLSPRGFESFMGTLKSQEYLPVSKQNEYVRSHPLTQYRIEALQARIAQSPYKDKPYPQNWVAQHERLKAKLIGYITPEQVQWIYDDRDKSIAAQYARAIAHYRTDDVDRALSGIDALLMEEVDNPYFLELKGDMLVNFGRGKEALPYYRRAINILNKAPMIRVALGKALLEGGNNIEYQKEAVQHLERALIDERRSPRIHRLLAIAYGRMGFEDIANIHLAEEAVLQHRIPYAKKLAEVALKNMKKGSREWLKAQDVLSYIKNIEEE